MKRLWVLAIVLLLVPAASATPTVVHKAGPYYAKKFGAKCDNSTNDTVAIQACADAAFAGRDTCFVGGASPCMISNITLGAWSTLQGSGMGQQGRLKRIVGATGTAIREKTAAEGNASGAGGLWIRDIYLDANGTAGDGINVGNQVGGNQLNFASGIDHVLVTGFSSGTGIIINQNAARVGYVWSNSNSIGIKTQGGGGSYHDVWAEANSTYNLQAQSSDDSFFHVHTEMAGVTPTAMVRVEGSQNRFYGNSLVQTANSTNNLVYIASGAVRNSFYEIMDNTNGFSFTNVVYVQAWASGTGSTDFLIHFWIDGAGGQTSRYYNQSDNSSQVFGAYAGETLGGDVASATTIAPTNTFFRVTGTTAIATITAPAQCSGGTVCCIDMLPTGLWTTTTAGNILLASTAVVGKTLRECYNPSTSKWSPSY